MASIRYLEYVDCVLLHVFSSIGNQCTTVRLRNDLYCVGWGVKRYSLQCTTACVFIVTVRSFVKAESIVAGVYCVFVLCGCYTT